MILFSSFSRFAKYVSSYYGILKDKGADAIVAVFDNDRRPHDERMRIVRDGLSKYPQADIITAIGIPVQNIEGWILSDITSLSNILGVTITEPPSPETLDTPDYYLDEIFASSLFLIRDSNLFKLIAENIDKRKLIQKCKSFERFHDEVSNVFRNVAGI